MRFRITTFVLTVCTLAFAAGAILIPLSVGIQSGDISFSTQYAYAHDTDLFHSHEESAWGESENNPFSGEWTLFGFSAIDTFFSWIFGWLGNIALTIFGVLLWIASVMLNQTVFYTVINMADLVKSIGTIGTTWEILRNLANIILIFTFLAIGIGTILRIEGYGIKRLLPRLIIVALLINFSLFFTQVIIDTSNILALAAYKQMELPSCSGTATAAFEADCSDGGISEKILQSLRLSTTYDPKNPTSGALAGLSEFDSNKSFTTGLAAIGGSIFVLIAAFVFFAAAILLIIRFAVLIFLMILSPIAFAFMILPKTQGYAKEWWSALFNQAFFAPIFFILLWISFKILETSTTSGSEQHLNFAQAIQGDQSAAGVFVSYGIVIAFLIFALIAAKKLSAHGSGTVIKWGHSLRNRAQGVVGRNTVGRAANLLNKGYDYSQTTRTGRNVRRVAAGASLGLLSDRNIRGTLGAGEKAKFGSKEGYADVRKDYQGNVERMMKKYGDNPAMQARYLRGLPRAQQEHAHSKLSARDRAAVGEHLDDETRTRLHDQLTIEEQEKTGKAARDASRAHRSRSARTALDEFARTGTISAVNPRTNATFTLDDATGELAASETRKIGHDARMNSAVVQHLTPVQLADILNNGDMTDAERSSITTAVYDPAHSNPTLATRQQHYMEGDLVRRLWGV